MKHPLIGALALIAVASVAVMARDADRKADRSAAASLVLADVAATPIMIEPAKAIVAPVEPGANVIGGSSASSMMVSEAQRQAIRREFSLLGADGSVRPNLRGLAVGARLPREKVRISRLPPQIAQIVPKYGVYEYFVTEGGSIVIVDPRAYQVVDIIGA